MKSDMGLDRITRNPEVMGGKPCVRGMRVTVGAIVGLVASGHPTLKFWPHTPTLKKKIFDRPSPTPPGVSRRSKFHFPRHETPDRHELEPVVGPVPGRFGFR